MRHFGIALVLLFSVTIAGCSSTNFVIYPDSSQDQNVEQVVRGGYTFLRSEKEGSVATVSLRRATESYVQTYVSISNRGSGAVNINPENVTVTVAEGEQTFSAYSPDEVPNIVKNAAEASRESFFGMNSMNVTGQSAMGGERGMAGSRGGYGSDSDSGGSYLDLMLKEQVLSGKQATSGLVFTPFSTGIQAFRLTVPIGDATHTFRFTVRKGE
jgi:hypothetical protein